MSIPHRWCKRRVNPRVRRERRAGLIPHGVTAPIASRAVDHSNPFVFIETETGQITADHHITVRMGDYEQHIGLVAGVRSKQWRPPRILRPLRTSRTDLSMTGRPFTPDDENGPLTHTPQHRVTNVREWPTRSVRNGPLFDIRGSVLAVNARQVAQNQQPHFLSNRERIERSMQMQPLPHGRGSVSGIC
jgi:hypothetical protein